MQSRHNEKAKRSHQQQSTKSARTTAPPRPQTTTTTLLPLTNEEPGPRQTSTSPVDNHEEVTLPDEEVTNPDQEPDEEEIQAAEVTTTETGNSATSAKSKGTDKRNARNELRRTSCAVMHKDEPTGPGCTSWTKIPKQRLSTLFTTKRSEYAMKTVHLTLPESSVDQEPQPFPSNSRVFSKELDDSPHPSS